MRRRWTIAVRVAVGAAIVLPLAGWLYERTAETRDARRFPPPGTLVDVGGRRLHLVCIGTGRPVVLFEASGLSNSASSSIARNSLAAHTTVCSYDRAGVGWSDPAPSAISIGELADDLRTLQDRAGVVSPFVVVTSSMGGWVTELFARRYPDRVAGVVFLDAGNIELAAAVNAQLDRWTWFEISSACALVNSGGRLGVVRLIDPFRFRRESSWDAERSAAVMYGAQPWRAVCAVVRGAARSLEEFAVAPALRTDLPVTVLSAARNEDLITPGRPLRASGAGGRIAGIREQLRATGEHLVRRSTRGSWRLVESGHLIATDQPSAVVDAVLEMLYQLRAEATTGAHASKATSGINLANRHR